MVNNGTAYNFGASISNKVARSSFKMPYSVLTSFNEGDLIPVGAPIEVLPGDTWKGSSKFVIRLTSPLVKPVMGNLNLDLYTFFVPCRLLWKHWKEFQGENTQSSWVPTVKYQVPLLVDDNSLQGKTYFGSHSLADYFSIPTKVHHQEVSVLPFRAYGLIYNEFFRDQNWQNPIVVSDDDTPAFYPGINDNAIDFSVLTCQTGKTKVAKACKYHDMYTSVLPSAQKGDPVEVSLTSDAPVYLRNDSLSDVYSPGDTIKLNDSIGPGGTTDRFKVSADILDGSSLWADTSSLTGITINQLRQAFAVQRMLEKDARGGSRYTEIIKTYFDVTSPDARQQRPEYLAGRSCPLNILTSVQQSATGATGSETPQANLAAYSVTADFGKSFVYSATEHGYIINLAVVRHVHQYQQGLQRQFFRKDRTDFYLPVFQSIGEQPIELREIFTSTRGTAQKNVFGYNEAWVQYRYIPSQVNGQFRSNSLNSLDFWHLADYYTQAPNAGDLWLREGQSYLDRALSVTSANDDQFIMDMFFDYTATRCMPIYSIPGLLDHN